MKIHYTAPKGRVLRIALDVLIIDAFQLPGTVTETMTVATAPMNLQSIARVTAELALEICLPVTMEIAFQEFIYVMATMTVLTTVMKTADTNAMTESVMMKLNSLAKRTKRGAELNVSRENGCVMGIRTASMVLMKIRLFTSAPLPNLAVRTNLLAEMDDASIRDGYAITTTTVAMELMKARNAILNTRLAEQTNLLAKTLSAFGTNIDAMEKTIAAIILTK